MKNLLKILSSVLKSEQRGFSLAELLISLALLGAIAAFTIPKILTSQQNSQKRAIAKDVASMIATAYQQYVTSNSLSTSTTFSNLTPYLNYVRVDTGTITIDDVPGYTSVTCSAADPCLVMHNGSVLRYSSTGNFGGSAPDNVLLFFFDPDATYSGSSTGSGKGMRFALYYNGRITSGGGLTAPVYSSNDSLGVLSDPTWFSW